MAQLPISAEIIIIGGGVIGLSTAYHLAKLGAKDVIVLERHQLTSGTSWHARHHRSTQGVDEPDQACRIRQPKLLPTLEAETGQATGYRQTGGYWLAQTQDRMTELPALQMWA